MDNNKALKKLLDGTATKKEIEALKQALARGEISIGGNVEGKLVIIGSGNTVEITPEKLGIIQPEKKTEEPIEGETPYMGLRYFDTSDADLFYGREALTAELLRRVKNESFLAIVGASGSGKSSVARAGLIPAWKKENERGIVHVITPTAHPLESLAASLTRDSESVTATSTLMDDLARDSRSLRLYVKKLLAGSGKPNALLLVDQFEETFTLCKDADERKAFIENLLTLADAEADGAARVVITLRADFYHHCFEYEELRLALQKHQENIGAMTQDELREAITLPAQANGWDFQPGLVDLILQDVGTEPGTLPLLSHALLETWKRRQGHTLTLQGYHEAGGVKKAITQTAESVYDKLSKEEQSIARRIFLDLTELGEDTQDTRRRVKLDRLAQSKGKDNVAKVLNILIDARLVVTEQDIAEVAHEALIRQWGTLGRWLDENRESLSLYRHMQKSAEEWQRRGKEASELYRGARLKQLQDWVKEHSDALSLLEREFVRASQNVKKRERMGWFAIAGVGLALLLLIMFKPAGMVNRLIYRPENVMPEEDWVTIPAGEFLMGSSIKEIEYQKAFCPDCDFSDEQPQHWVDLPEYQIWKYEITNEQFDHCIRASACNGAVIDSWPNYPVVDVNWYAAEAYCKWVGGRLPTEAEWEKAASWDFETQTKFNYPWGNNDPTQGLLNDNNGYRAMLPVGTYPAGENGLFDMAGNVWEWVNDWYDGDYYQKSPSSNPLGPDSGQFRVLRGSSWNYSGYDARSAQRSRNGPYYTYYDVGFRCARSLP